MKLILTLLLIPSLAFGAFTEFYCQSGGSNLNACSTNNNTAAYTSTSGNWVQATRIFTVTDGTNPSSSVSVGDFASVYADGATVGVYIGRVSAVDNLINGTITMTNAAEGGSPPTNGTANRTIKVGGACKGPNGAEIYPFSINFANLKNTSGDQNRINMKNDATYSITAAILNNDADVIQGYSSSVGDGGKATIDAGTAAITILTASGNSRLVADLILIGNSTNTASRGLSLGASNALRCVVHGVGGFGFLSNSQGAAFIQCEAYNCNRANTASVGGFQITTGQKALFCISHDNTGSNASGFVVPSGAGQISIQNCIADSNGSHGILLDTTTNGYTDINQTDCYNNGGDGIKNPETTSNVVNIFIRNCNFVKNTGYGINSAHTTGRWYNSRIDNCGFGSGTQSNGSGQTNNTDNVVISGSVTYTANLTPWVDPANGDFRVNLAEANWAGLANFTETDSNYSAPNTVGFPDIGAAQSKTGAGGTFSKETSHTFGQ